MHIQGLFRSFFQTFSGRFGPSAGVPGVQGWKEDAKCKNLPSVNLVHVVNKVVEELQSGR